MKKSIFIIFFCITFSIQANAQADCFFKYCYIGKVSLNTKTAKNKKIFLQLPSPESMLKIVDETKGFLEVKISGQLNYEKKSVSTGSSVFCGTPDNIIESVLKGNNRVYTIYIINGEKKYKRTINIKDIAFFYKGDTFYITLPKIVI